MLKRTTMGVKSNRSERSTERHTRSWYSQTPKSSCDPEIIPLIETACGVCGLRTRYYPRTKSPILLRRSCRACTLIKRQNAQKIVRIIAGSKIITAPILLKLIPGSPYGNSIWKRFLPCSLLIVHWMILAALAWIFHQEYNCGGLQKITLYLKAVYKAFHQQQMTENKFHNEETLGGFTSG